MQRGCRGGAEGVPCSYIARLVSLGVQPSPEGIYRSSLDARKPQNPINSEEYQGQGVLYST